MTQQPSVVSNHLNFCWAIADSGSTYLLIFTYDKEYQYHEWEFQLQIHVEAHFYTFFFGTMV